MTDAGLSVITFEPEPPTEVGVTMSILPTIEGAARVRWLLLTSLALNVCFVGAAGAVAFRYTGAVPLTTVTRINHSVTGRLNQIAATLPSTDAQLMRSELRADAVKVARAQADFRLSREELRSSLRAEPFDADAMRAAMAANRAARENFDRVLHDVIASAAAKMSVVGRNKLADWSATRGTASAPQ
jgi:uncharacterized membrane protein